MQPPAVKAIEQPGAFFGGPGKESPSPVEVTAVRPRRDMLEADAVAWHGGREASILRRIFFRREVATTAPRLITDAPKLYFEWIAARHIAACSQLGSGGASSRRVTVLDPSVELLRTHSTHVDRHVRLRPGEFTETHELVGSELIR